jgi:hypothetical protein
MKCPQCGTRNPLGSESCSNCGRAFTRSRIQSPRPATNPYPESEETRQFPADQVRQRQGQSRPDVHVHVQQDDYGYDDEYAYPEAARRSRGMNCVTVLALLLVLAIVLVIAAILATNLFVRPRVEEALATNVGAGIETIVSEQISAELGNLPTGEITLTEADINQRIAEQGNLGPVGDLNVNIVPNGFEADLSAYGLDGGFSSDVTAENGQIQLSNSSVSGPLQYLVSAGEVERIAAGAINRSLAESGYRVEEVTLQDGVLVLTLAQ